MAFIHRFIIQTPIRRWSMRELRFRTSLTGTLTTPKEQISSNVFLAFRDFTNTCLLCTEVQRGYVVEVVCHFSKSFIYIYIYTFMILFLSKLYIMTNIFDKLDLTFRIESNLTFFKWEKWNSKRSVWNFPTEGNMITSCVVRIIYNMIIQVLI